MPPPSFVPDGLAVEAPEMTDLVRSQDIIFLVVQRTADDINAPWDFPSKEDLDDLVDSVTADLLETEVRIINTCLLYTSPSPRDLSTSRMPSSA